MVDEKVKSIGFQQSENGFGGHRCNAYFLSNLVGEHLSERGEVERHVIAYEAYIKRGSPSFGVIETSTVLIYRLDDKLPGPCLVEEKIGAADPLINQLEARGIKEKISILFDFKAKGGEFLIGRFSFL